MKTQRHEIEAWLGDSWSPEQIEELVNQIEALGEDATENDWVAICQAYDGTLDLAELGEVYLRRGVQTEEARQALHAGIRAASKTTSEAEMARIAGVTRMTVRKALGK